MVKKYIGKVIIILLIISLSLMMTGCVKTFAKLHCYQIDSKSNYTFNNGSLIINDVKVEYDSFLIDEYVPSFNMSNSIIIEKLIFETSGKNETLYVDNESNFYSCEWFK